LSVPRPRFRLGYALELVAVLAVGLAFLRLWTDEAEAAPRHLRLAHYFKAFGDSFPTGVALAGLLGLGIEVARGRSPAIWGLGRWVWSFAGLCFFFESSFMVVVNVADNAHHGKPIDFVSQILEWLPWFGAVQWGAIAWGVVAVALTRRLARLPPDPAPDAREWSGRVFAGFLMAWAVADKMVMVLSR
jgi:hypothetical protein